MKTRASKKAQAQAVKTLRALYQKAIKADDFKTAFQAQRELNRLMGFYVDNAGADSTEQSEGAADALKQLELIAGHILPLKLADETYPLEEHARLAAQFVRESPAWRAARGIVPKV